jgi:hypothetical protein
LEKTLSVSRVVDAFEEGELGRVESSGWVEGRSHVLNSHVGMTDDITAGESLGCSIVGSVGIGERSSDEVRHLNADVEGGVGLDSSASI